jgi:hypothetical protein
MYYQLARAYMDHVNGGSTVTDRVARMRAEHPQAVWGVIWDMTAEHRRDRTSVSSAPAAREAALAGGFAL